MGRSRLSDYVIDISTRAGDSEQRILTAIRVTR
jgi:hypothetical protein